MPPWDQYESKEDRRQCAAAYLASSEYDLRLMDEMEGCEEVVAKIKETREAAKQLIKELS